MVTLDVGQRRSSSPGTAASTACRKLRNSAARCRRRARSPPSGAASARRRETCCTVAADRPHAATTERVLQGMAFSGVVSSVQVSRAAICSSVRGRGTPRRGAGPGALPAGPRQSARALCRPRVSWWPAPRRAIAVLLSPAVARKTLRQQRGRRRVGQAPAPSCAAAPALPARPAPPRPRQACWVHGRAWSPPCLTCHFARNLGDALAGR
jgi:hypothetical protein